MNDNQRDIAERELEKQGERFQKATDDYIAFIAKQTKAIHLMHMTQLGSEQRRAMTTEQALTEQLENAETEVRTLRMEIKHAQHAVFQLGEARRTIAALMDACVKMKSVLTGEDPRPATAQSAVSLADKAFGVASEANWQ